MHLEHQRSLSSIPFLPSTSLCSVLSLIKQHKSQTLATSYLQCVFPFNDSFMQYSEICFSNLNFLGKIWHLDKLFSFSQKFLSEVWGHPVCLYFWTPGAEEGVADIGCVNFQTVQANGKGQQPLLKKYCPMSTEKEQQPDLWPDQTGPEGDEIVEQECSTFWWNQAVGGCNKLESDFWSWFHWGR